MENKTHDIHRERQYIWEYKGTRPVPLAVAHTGGGTNKEY